MSGVQQNRHLEEWRLLNIDASQRLQGPRRSACWPLHHLGYAERLFQSGLRKDGTNGIQCSPKGTKPLDLRPSAQCE